MNEQELSYMSSLFRGVTKSEKRELINVMPNKILYAYYDTHAIPKKRGGKRIIYEPNETLKKIQRRIYNNLLKDKPVSDYAFAYVPGRNVLDNAKPHVKNPILLKLDIHRFFDNIHFDSVFEIFRKIGYSEQLSRLLAGLTTIEDFLPQGAPTSPALSNLFLKEFDEEIGDYCKKHNIVYTRYSDDLTFSMHEFNKEVVVIVKEKLEKLGLELNRKKSKVISGPLQKRVTGIVVNEKPQTPLSYRRKIRQEMYYITKYGLSKHLKHNNIEDSETYVNSLLGRIDFVLQINKNNTEFSKYKTTLLKQPLNSLKSQLDEILH